MTSALFPTFRYSYNYDLLPPLAMSNGLQVGNFPSREWIEKVIAQGIELVVNDIVAKVKLKGENLSADAVDSARADAESLFEPLRKQKDIVGLVKSIKSIFDAQTSLGGYAQGIEAYDDIFATIPVPDGKHNLEDGTFADLRVAGFNPLALKNVTSLPEKFPLTQEQFAKAVGFTDDHLESALKDGRLFLVDFEVLQLEPGQTPAPKHVYRPIGLFGIPKAGGNLAAIAIQGGQDPSVYPIFSPSDGDDWLKMKTAFNCADGSYHELISHLGRTHLLIEAFIVATHKEFDDDHPVYRLVVPSLEGTDFINAAAVEFLVNEGGGVDKLLMGTITSDLKVTAQSVLSPGFDELMLPRFLNEQGLMDPRLVYPFRDDALLVWNTIREWVSSYLGLYYTNDEDVQKDKSVQKWAADLVAEDGARLRGFGQSGGIVSLEYLTDALTMILFTAGPLHAAVNFPQSTLMSYTPTTPLAGYQPIPNEPASNTPWLDMLPPIDMAQLQLKILYLLGTVYYTRLGEYPSKTFKDEKVEPLLANFQANLATVEAEINTRNLTRSIDYNYLRPSKIPISINI